LALLKRKKEEEKKHLQKGFYSRKEYLLPKQHKMLEAILLEIKRGHPSQRSKRKIQQMMQLLPREYVILLQCSLNQPKKNRRRL